MLKKLTIFIFLLTGFAWSFSVSAATCPMDNGAGVGCNAGNNEYYCGSACRQLSAGTTPTLNFCQNNFQVCAPGVDCSNSYAAAYPCGVPQACNGGYTLCNVAGTGASSFPDSKCKANVAVPTGCSTYNQCTSICSACSAGYELLAGTCIGATVRLGTDSVMSDRLKNSTMPLMSILASGNVGIGITDPNDIFSIGNSGSAPLGSVNTGHNYTSTYLSADDYALVNYGIVKTLINSAASSSALFGGTVAGDIWNLNSGNVGIGTTSPQFKLDVVSNARPMRIQNTDPAGYTELLIDNNVPYPGNIGGFVFGYGGTSSGQANSAYLVNRNNGPISFWTNYIERMRILGNGNVGIGTTTPAVKLAVEGVVNIGSSGTNGGLNIYKAGTVSPIFSYDPANGNIKGSSGYVNWQPYNPGTADNTFVISHSTVGNFVWRVGMNINDPTVLPELMRLTHGGNLGIGTSVPNDTLSIGNSGAAPVGSLATGHNFTSTYLTTDDYALTNYGIVKSLISSSATTNALWNGTKNGNIWNGDAGAGNVGIGTTNPITKLDVNAPDGSGITVRNSGESSDTLQLFNVGATTASRRAVIQGWRDTVGAIPLTLQESGGNVGIGTTAPAGKLDVSAGLASQTAGDLVVDTASNIVYIGKLDSVSNNTNLIFRDRLGNVKSRWENAGAGSISFGNFTTNRGVTISNSVPALNATTSARFVVDSGSTTFPAAVFMNGNVGIGTTTPGGKLEVDIASAGDGFRVVGNGVNSPQFSLYSGSTQLGAVGLALGSTHYSWLANTNDVVLRATGAGSGGNLILTTQNANGNIYLATGSNSANDSAKMTILNNGNVGIGTTIPNDIFSIGNSGSAPIGSDHTGHNYTMTYLSSDPYALVNYGTTMSLINAATSSNALWNGTKNGSIYNGDAGAGSVGIGTTTPSAPLEVIGTSNTTGSIRVTAPNVTDAPWMEFSTPGVGIMGRITNSNGFRFKSNYDVSMIAGAGAGNGFKIWNSAATVQYLTVLGSNGNVGIGTATPAYKLDIAGGGARIDQSQQVRDSAGFSDYGLSFQNPGNPQKFYIGYNMGGYFGVGYYSGAVYSNLLAIHTNYTAIKTANGEAMRIDSLGNVGIGTTNPSGALSLTRNLVLNDNKEMISFSHDNSYNLKLFQNFSASGVMQYNWVQKVSGIDNYVLTFKQGNVGIGTTAPNDIFSIGNAGAAPTGSSNTGHNYTSTYLSADDYALTNYGLVKTLIASATSSSALFGGTIAGDIWNLNAGNFGIGTTTPAAKLDLVGLMKMRVATSSITQSEDVVNKGYLDYKIGTANTVGKYVGVTVAAYSGNNSALGVGYDKANDQCAADVPGSHVCATSEILNTIATKGAMPTDSIVWVFNGPPGYTVEANDCDGRASNRTTSYGAVWQTDISKWTNGRGMLTTCNNSNKFACCK